MRKLDNGVGFKVGELLYTFFNNEIRVLKILEIKTTIIDDNSGQKVNIMVIIEFVSDNSIHEFDLFDNANNIVFYREISNLCSYKKITGEIICPNCKSGLLVYDVSHKEYRKCNNQECMLNEEIKGLMDEK